MSKHINDNGNTQINGHDNAHVNGHSNAHVNGHTNDNSNGRSNGRSNDTINSHLNSPLPPNTEAVTFPNMPITYDVVERTIEPCKHQPQKYSVLEYMLDPTNASQIHDEAIYLAAYDESLKHTFLNWLYAFDDRYGFPRGTILYYYKWACAFRVHRSFGISSIMCMRFIHNDIYYNDMKIHTNFIVFTFEDGVFVEVPITETVDYSRQ